MLECSEDIREHEEHEPNHNQIFVVVILHDLASEKKRALNSFQLQALRVLRGDLVGESGTRVPFCLLAGLFRLHH